MKVTLEVKADVSEIGVCDSAAMTQADIMTDKTNSGSEHGCLCIVCFCSSREMHNLLKQGQQWFKVSVFFKSTEVVYGQGVMCFEVNMY